MSTMYCLVIALFFYVSGVAESSSMITNTKVPTMIYYLNKIKVVVQISTLVHLWTPILIGPVGDSASCATSSHIINVFRCGCSTGSTSCSAWASCGATLVIKHNILPSTLSCWVDLLCHASSAWTKVYISILYMKCVPLCVLFLNR